MTFGTTRLNGNAGVSIDITAFLAGDLSEIRVLALVNNFGWQYGVGANQVDVVYADTITLTLGSTVTLDLYAGTPGLLDVHGRAITMEAIKFLYVKNTSSDSGLLIGGGGGGDDILIFAATSDILYLPPGGVFLWYDPSAAGVATTVKTDLKLMDDSAGAAGNRLIEVIAMGLDG